MKRLLIAVVLLAGLSGVVYWSNKQEANKPEPNREGKVESENTPKVLELKADMVKQFTITRRMSTADASKTPVQTPEPVTLGFNESGKWEILAPRRYSADPSSVASVTSAASNLIAERVVDKDVKDLATYGLSPATIQVDFQTKDGKSHSLLIGDTTATNDGVYVKLASDPRLFTVTAANKNAFDKGLRDFRDKRLVLFDQDRLSRIVLTAKGQTIDFTKGKESQWQISKPRPLRSDFLQVDELVTKLKGANMLPEALDDDAAKSLAAFNAATQVARIEVTDPAGSKSLEIRKSKDTYYAKSSTTDGAYRVAKDLADAFDKPLNDFRDKKVFDFSFSDPEKIELKDGDKAYAFERKAGKDQDVWTSADNKKMDGTSVQAFIDRLRDLTAVSFPESGYTTTIVTLRVVSNTGLRDEKVEISKAANGDFIARRAGDIALYTIEAKAMNDLRQAVNDVRPDPNTKK
jgi:hypothetical protein